MIRDESFQILASWRKFKTRSVSTSRMSKKKCSSESYSVMSRRVGSVPFRLWLWWSVCSYSGCWFDIESSVKIRSVVQDLKVVCDPWHDWNTEVFIIWDQNTSRQRQEGKSNMLNKQTYIYLNHTISCCSSGHKD